jgi:hypothetical protein
LLAQGRALLFEQQHRREMDSRLLLFLSFAAIYTALACDLISMLMLSWPGSKSYSLPASPTPMNRLGLSYPKWL